MSAAPAPNEIISSRRIAMPREQVFDAFADPKQLTRWFGPDGFTSTFEKFDFRVGGEWVFMFHGPDGRNYPNHSTFIEIVEPERIVYDHDVPPHFRMTITLAADGDATLLIWRMSFAEASVCETLKSICIPANEQNFNRLEVHLADR